MGENLNLCDTTKISFLQVIQNDATFEFDLRLPKK